MYTYVNFEVLKGKTITKIDKTEDEIYFETDGGRFKMFHNQDCCESVSIEDISGDLNDLLNTPVLSAYESSSSENPDPELDGDYTPESQTWTFYRVSTVKGTVVIRWYGSSNGYYSESVTFEKLD